MDCIFCKILENEIPSYKIYEDENVFAFLDITQGTKGHTLIIPKRHVANYFDLYQPELNAIHNLLNKQRDQIIALDPTITGFNVGVNEGTSAGQTIFHAHIHLIPRRKGDVEDPRGGVRGVIPSKQKYEKK